MDNKLILELHDVLPNGMEIPKEIQLLYEWIETNNLYSDSPQLKARVGFLYPEDELKRSRTDKGRKGGTTIEFYAQKSEFDVFWFGRKIQGVKDRLCVFAQSGGDGSVCALWLNDKNETKIVHIGSGSGSMLLCKLGKYPIDFLQLVAIGYDEICWDEEYDKPPSSNPDFVVEPNIEFQNWVKSTFNVDIPKTASEVVQNPANMDDESSEDDFFNWCQKFME